ncbi:hypothetical protein ACFP56_20810 [Paenibacillus septentrionalis]|uniref:Uncharacterized protein n=1 Tax=Paenibacillus septentrionalis TaxID=429342 RepID=A0ABW1VC57_9BACL
MIKGMGDSINGTFFPAEAWSKEHVSDMLGTVSIVGGGVAASIGKKTILNPVKPDLTPPNVPKVEPFKPDAIPDMRARVEANIEASTGIREASKIGEYLKKEKELLESIKNKDISSSDSIKGTGKVDNPYNGVKQASEYLISQGVPRQFRKTTLESFVIGTIKLDVAGPNTYGIRFYDNINASAKGRYLFETFSPQVNRNNLALPPDWNRMTGIQQWQVKLDTIIIKGKAGPQFQMGDHYTGGVEQWYITNLDDLIKP